MFHWEFVFQYLPCLLLLILLTLAYRASHPSLLDSWHLPVSPACLLARRRLRTTASILPSTLDSHLDPVRTDHYLWTNPLTAALGYTWLFDWDPGHWFTLPPTLIHFSIVLVMYRSSLTVQSLLSRFVEAQSGGDFKKNFIEDLNTQISPGERTEADRQQTRRWAQAHDTDNPKKSKSKTHKTMA